MVGDPHAMAHRDEIGALHELAAKESRVGRLKPIEVIFRPRLSGDRAPHVAHGLLEKRGRGSKM